MDAANNKEGTPKQLRGRSLGTRLSEPEYAQCERTAARRGQSLSEWCRQVLLAPQNRDQSAVWRESGPEPLDRERMRELIESADADKLAKAAERLSAVRGARAGAKAGGDDTR